MPPTAPIAFRPGQAGGLSAALVLHALGGAALQFGSEYVALFETPLAWALRVLALAAFAFGLIQLSALTVRRLAGSAVAAVMRQRMIIATLSLGLLGVTSLASNLPNVVLFGLVIGLAWRKWTSSPLLWLVAAAAASVAVHAIDGASWELPVQMVGFPVSRAVSAIYLGLIWSLLTGVAFALLVSFAPPESWETWQGGSFAWAERLPLPRFIPRVLLALALAGGLWVTYDQGVQNCGWIDRFLSRSGCVDTLSTDWGLHDSMDFSQDGAMLLVAGTDNLVLYDFARRRAIQEWEMPGGRAAEGAAISADGSQIAMYLNSQGFDDEIKIYRRGESEPFQSIAVGEAAMPDLGFSLDGRSLRFQDTIWDIATGAPLGQINAETSADYRIISRRFSADGSLRVEENGAQVTLYRNQFDGSIGTRIKTLFDSASYSASVIAFSDDNSLLATAARDDKTLIKIWRTSDGSLLKTIALTPVEKAAVSALTFTPDSRFLLVARLFQDNIGIYQIAPEPNP